jgi:two-component system, OmpR family, sensor histidine kinase BaeS
MLGEARDDAGVAEGGAWTARSRGTGKGTGTGAEGESAPEKQKGERREAQDGPWVVAGLWGFGIAAAWVGTAIIYESGMGINWAIWVTVLSAGLAWSATRKGRRLDPAARWAIGLAVLVGWGSAITDSGLFQALITVTCAGLLATAARIATGVPGNRTGVWQMLTAPMLTSVFSIFEMGRRVVDGVGAMSGGRNRPIVRGVAIAVPIALVFAMTLAGADPVLTHWRSVILRWVSSITFVPTAVAFVSLGVVALGTFGLALRGSSGTSETLAFDGPPAWLIGQAERSIIIAAVAIVFGVFLALQPTYLFRNVDALRVSGMSYADYAHQGFGELTVAATLCVLLILALDRRTRREANPGRTSWPARWGYWGPLLLVAEVLVVLASAWHRVSMYEASYGFTTLRVYVQAFIAGVAIALVLLASELSGYEGDFDGRRVARRVAAAAALFLAAFSFGNAEQWVVDRNVERYRAIGKIDARYLTDLSLNAAPSVVASLGDFSPACAEFIRSRYRESYTQPQAEGWFTHTRWFEWNYRHQRGLDAVHTALSTANSEVAPAQFCDRQPAAR